MKIDKIDKIREKMKKITMELRKKTPKHLQNDENYTKNIFIKQQKEVKKLLNEVNKLDQTNGDVIKIKNDLVQMDYYTAKFIKAFIGGTRRRRKKKNKTFKYQK
jgi:hypothetical protein